MQQGGITNSPDNRHWIPEGFRDAELVYRDAHTFLLRAVAADDAQRVLITGPADRPGSDVGAARTANHARMLERIDGSGVPRLLGFRRGEDRLMAVMEDPGGILLSRWLAARGEPLSFREWLAVLLSLSRTLQAVHEAEIIHKNLHPHGILVSADGPRVSLVDFGLATECPRELQEVVPIGSLAGSLPYLAPEQTGRMARGIDVRSDLYALGAVAFELVSGAPPFGDGDPLQLVHSHLARSPQIGEALRRRHPPWLFAIVEKLLAKEPGRRYQTAASLVADLERIREAVAAGDEAPCFALDRTGSSRRFELPGRLYGREEELARLREVFLSSARGPVECVYVHGASGIGKTALVEELRGAVAAAQGVFVAGKFEQYQLDVPYSGLGRALRGLLRWLVQLPEEALGEVRRRVQAGLGDEALALAEIEPALARLLGRPAPLDPVPGLEARQRHARVLRAFFRALGSPDRPLVLFLDDMQWSDGDSVRLLQALAEDGAVTGLLIVLSARDHEIPPGHPLPTALGRLQDGGARLHDMGVGPLSQPALEELLHDALGADGDLRPLASILDAHSQGNPLHLQAALESLREQGLIRLDPASEAWTVDPHAATEALGGAGLDRRLQGWIGALAERDRRILAAASVVGSRFTVREVAAITGHHPEETMKSLCEAIRYGLVDRVHGLGELSPAVPPPSAPGESSSTRVSAAPPRNGSFLFRHDRIQRAAYALLGEDERVVLHLRIGHWLLGACGEEGLEDRILTIVGHLNLARDRIEGATDRLQLAELNALAARRAQQSGSYETAARCAGVGLDLLGGHRWQERPALTLELSSIAAECTALIGDLVTLASVAEAVRNYADRPLDRLRAQKALVLGYAIQGEMHQAVQACREGLAWFGVAMPSEPTEEDVRAAFAAAEAAIGSRDPVELAELPALVNREEIAIFELYDTLIAVAYITSRQLFSWMILTAVARSAGNGNPPGAAFFYSCMGIIVMSATRDAARTARFGELGLALAERTPARGARGRALFLVGSALTHWTEPLQTGIARLSRSRRLLRDAGDLEFAGYADYNILEHRLLSGERLDRLLAPTTESWTELGTLNLTTAKRWVAILAQFVHLLSRGTASSLRLEGAYFRPDAELPAMAAAQDHTALAIYHIYSLLFHLLGGRFEDARRHARKARPWHHGMATFPSGAAFAYLETCALLHPAAPGDPLQDPAIKARVDGHGALLRLLARANASLYGPQLHTVNGLAAWAQGDETGASHHFEAAIAIAESAGLSHQAGLAAEFAAWCLHRRDAIAEEGRAWRRAERAYRDWGAAVPAERCARHAEACFPAGSPAVDTGGRDLDFRSLSKASRILAGELDIQELPDRLLDVVLENAGATAGALVYLRKDQWRARLRGLGPDAPGGETIPLREADRLPCALIHDVLRTGRAVVSPDPAAASPPHDEGGGIKSMACLPILYAGQILGAIYLENDLVSGVFASGRLDALQVLCSQAAVALQNALLYSDLKDSEERLRAIVDHSIDIISMLDGDGRFTFVSPAVERLLGYAPDDLYGRSSLDYVHPEDRGEAERAWTRLTARPGGQEQRLVRCRHRTGSWRTLEIVGKNHFQTPGVHGILLNGRDVTERLEADERLQRSQRLEAVGQLTGGVAHDFNNLLTVILGSLDIMADGLASQPELRPLAEEAMRAAHRGATLTRSLLAFSRRQPLQPTAVDLRLVLNDLADLLRRTTPEDIALDFRPGPTLPPCRADAGQLQNMILNLAVNARDAMPHGGRLRIQTGARTLTPAEADREGIAPGRYLALSVEDTGVGMSPEVASRVFEPFFTTKERGQGTGLGLSMVFGFARQSGGTVLLDTQEGAGTTVTVLLPEAEASAPTPKPGAEPRPARGANEMVLVVEDEETVRDVATAMLRSLGYRVHAAASAEEAELALAGRPEIRLVLSDVVLAGDRSGIDVARVVAEQRPDVRIILMTGYAEDALARAPTGLVDAPLLEKPFTKQQLATIIARALG